MSTTQTLHVTGMTCQHCVKHVREALVKVTGVDDVAIDLASGKTDVAGSADRAALIQAVRDAGYDVTGN